ncbi:MAG: hypothetical protein AAB778_03750 [Patescibacteria group bacterium]
MSMKLEAILQADSNKHPCSLPKPRDPRLPITIRMHLGQANNGDHEDDERFESHLIQTIGLENALNILEKIKK